MSARDDETRAPATARGGTAVPAHVLEAIYGEKATTTTTTDDDDDDDGG